MNKIFTRFALVLAVVFGFAGSQNLYATHITGSDISFRCLGGNNYQVLVAVYRDCSGTTMPTDIPINVSRGCASDTSITATLDAASSNVEVSQLCPSVVSTCNGGNLPGVQLYTYIANININPGCGSFTFSYGDCCRNTSTNLEDPSAPSLSFYVEATLNTNAVVCNNAPIFTSLPVPYFCVNQPVNYSHGALDLDGDSLSYKLITPLDNTGTPLPYNPGYSATNPLATASGFNFDAATGQMSFTPTTQGSYVADVLVSEYRNGVLIGTTMRDIQIIVINCSNASPVVQNSLTTSNVTGGVVQDYNSVGVCPGSTLSFTITARDPDGQAVTVTSNLGTSIPTASLTTVNVGVDSVRTTFTWTPSATDTGFRYFTVQFEDNACPITGLQLFTYDITIFDGTDAGPNRYYCPSGGPVQVNAFGGSHFSWNTTVGMISANPDSSIVFLAPPATTTYIIQSDLQGGCKDKDTITVFNVPSISTGITATFDTICLNQTATLTVTASPGNEGPFTYLWSRVSDGVLTPTQQSTVVKPNGPTTYYVRVVSNAGCVVTDSFDIAIDGIAPRVNIFPSDNEVCPGQVVTLTASVSAVNCGPANPATACGPNSTFDIQDVGTGNATGSAGVTPYRGFYDDGRVQYLYRASELQALGLTSGAITDIAFNVATKNSTAPYNSYTIKMSCTDLTELPTNFVTGLSQVLNPVAYTTFTGWNNHTLDIPYNWDGFSNLIVEVCFDNASFTGDDAVYYTTTSFNSVLADEGDLATASGCSGLNSPTQGKNRPNTEFVMCKASLDNYHFTWVGNNGVTLVDSDIVDVTVNRDVTFNLTVNDGVCTGDTFINLTIDSSVFVSAGNDTTYCGLDTIQLNTRILNPAVPACKTSYSISTIPYAAIPSSGPVTFGPVGDEDYTSLLPLGFPFSFYCQQYSQFAISPNGFISFSALNSGYFSPSALPDPLDPNNLVALCWEDLDVSAGGSVDYFTAGTAPNRVQVIRWKNVPYYNSTGTLSGEIHLFETSNVIELHVNRQNGSAQNTNVLGIENNNGTLSASPTGYNYTGWVANSPIAYRFTPGTTQNNITSVLWTPSTGLSSDTAVNPLAFPLATTTYVVAATFASGCVAYDTVTLNITSFPHTVSVSRDSICPGDTVQITFAGNAVKYNWTPANTLSSDTISNPLAFPQVSTTYQVIAQDPTGCRILDTARVNIEGKGPVTLGNDTVICPYDSLLLIPSGSPYVSYVWSTGVTDPAVSTGAQTASTQDYFVKVYDGLCYFNSDTLTVSKTTLVPVGVLPAGDTTICSGDTIVMNVQPGYATYTWNTGANTQAINVSSAGSFWYTARTVNGCVVSSKDTANVDVRSFPYTLTVSPDTICPGDTAQLTFTGNGTSYAWSPVNTLSSGTISNPLAFPNTSTTYRVTVVDSFGCRVIDTARIVIKGKGPVTLGADTNICPYDSLILIPSGAPYATYIWSTGAVTPTISTGAQTAPVQNYFVQVFDGFCYFNSDTLTLGEFYLPAVGVLPAGDTGICVGASIVLAVESGYAGYVWNTGDTTQSITVSTAGDFSFIATDANGCVINSKDTTTVALVQPPVAAIISTRDTICEGQPAILYVDTVAGVSYSWNPGNVVADSFTITTSGEYFLTANDNGCAALDSVTIVGVQPSVLNLGADINVCGCDTSIVITAGLPGTIYQWNNNASDSSITVNASGVYSVTVTEASNCTTSDAVEVNIRCLTINALVANPTTATVLAGGTATLDVDSFSYNGSFTYAWTPNTYLQDSAVQQPVVQSPQQTTTYVVKVTDADFGCVAVDSVVLSVVPPGIPPMPNAFSPNGDGRNDVFGPYFPPSLQGAYTIGEMRIYNRWGQAVYNGDGYWDGTFNGAMQQAGTYMYYITIKGPDQDNPSVTKNYNMQGAFTLLH